MSDVRDGYLVFEGCHECGARSSFFTTEAVPPVDEYREGRHYWIYQGSFQATRFSLICNDCGARVALEDMTALMLSSCTEPDCGVGQLVRSRGPGTWIYVALCRNSSHSSGACVSDEGIEALNQYFNQDVDPSERKVLVVPCKLCNHLDTCRGTVIADTGLTEIY
jgi:hypothetical protein